MFLPEWEIEAAIAINPSLLEIPGVIENIEFTERQKYLPTRKSIDILFKQGESYVIAEIKKELIRDSEVVTHQLIGYKKDLAKLLKIRENKIKCILASPAGCSSEIEELCKKCGVFVKRLSIKEIIGSIPLLDENSKRDLAKLFREVSKTAPICAHEVGTNSDGQLRDNKKMWFWFFYSVLDRRANAATFHKAAEALEKIGLFDPKQINNIIHKHGEGKAINTIREILEGTHFPLIMDRAYGFDSFPKSIIDAVKFIAPFNYDFINLYNIYKEKAEGDLNKTYKLLYKDIKKQIYGAGDRITGQIIRGLVLKGPWALPLTDNKLLEYTRHNALFAGRARLRLVDYGVYEQYLSFDIERELRPPDKEIRKVYDKQLGEYADTYLNGNRGIVSHVLWYIRRRYCHRTPNCSECLFARYCGYYKWGQTQG